MRTGAREGADPGSDAARHVVPRCPHAGSCGGCTWQHLSYDEQRRLKRVALQTTLDAALGADAVRVAALLPPDGRTTLHPATPWGFRDKVHFVVAGDRGSVVLGHFAPGGASVIPVSECPVHAEAGNLAAARVRDVCNRLGLPAASIDGRRGLLRHVVVRVGRATGEVLVTLVVTDAGDRRVRRLVEALAEGECAPDGIHVNELRGASPWLFGPTTRKVHGRAYLREQVADTSFLVPPTAFFQTNVTAAETLVRLVLGAVPPEARHVLDLYAGVGLFAVPLARRGHRVVAVEEHAGAVEAGRMALRLNGLDERACRFVRGRVEDALRRLLTGGRDGPGGRAARDPARFAAVVLDPPRAGCSAEVVRALVERAQPETVVYASCEPEALARDLRVWLATGRAARVPYRVDRVQPLDMFPHTTHLEAVAVLRRAHQPGGPSYAKARRAARESRGSSTA